MNGIRHAPPAPKTEDPSPISGGGEQEGQRDPDRQPGYHDAHAQAAFLEGRLARNNAPVVRVKEPRSETGDHAQCHEADQGRHEPAQDGRDAGPDDADHDYRPVPEPVPHVSARELHQHVTSEQQAADQPARGERVLDALQDRNFVLDHITDRRSGDRAVGAARHPS